MLNAGNQNWSEEETQGPFIYSNDFGEVVLEPVTAFMPISEISSKSIPEIREVLISLECAEKVALITESKRIAMSIVFPIPKDTEDFNYVIKYSSACRGAVCRVKVNCLHLKEGTSAQSQLEKMASKTMGPIPMF